MSPGDALSSIDSFIAERGQDITFIAILDGLQFPCRGFVRDENVIISATDLAALGQRAAVGDPLIPTRGDKLLVNSRRRNIEKVEPVTLDNVLIRVNLTTKFDLQPMR